jgi:3-dehydroquinate synthase
MDDITSLRVGLGARAYDIKIGNNLIANAGDVLGNIVAGRQAVIVSDSNVAPLHLDALASSLARVTRRCDRIIVPAGEASKNMQTLTGLLNDILDLGVDRGLVIVALGGGVIGDLAGFAAASLMRGVDFIQVPTSLLAQVDSSVGGKTGVNAPRGKNLIGAFYQPRAVLADTAALTTLPPRELRAGYAEVAKYGLLGDASFFAWLEDNGKAMLELEPQALNHAIMTSCAAKARIVEADEREAGQRALLNLGHTFAHAFEAEANYDGRLLHGEAVAAGMGVAFALSVRMGLCDQGDLDRVKAHLRGQQLPGDNKELAAGTAAAERLIAHMQNDKKVLDGKMRFILVKGIGEAFVASDVPLDDVRATLEGLH